MSEHVLVAGSGIAGLGAALALGGTRRVTLVDRDSAAPGGDAEDAFAHWERRGATQLRHSHVFLGRLTTLIQERYPDLLKDLTEAGARVFTFEDGLPPPLRDGYSASPGDEDLSILFSRRTTLELVMRRYVLRQHNVTFLNDAGVRGLSIDGTRVLGLKVERDGTTQDMLADVIVDATGRNTSFPDWLREAGFSISEEERPAGILYFTRHYKLKDGAEEPVRDGTPGAGDLGYIKFGVFPADNRHFSITLAVPEIETELRMAVMKPEVFDAICDAIPGCARWIDRDRAGPASQVFAMGNLKSTWRRFDPRLEGFFAIGDAAVRTNPLYGRGCSAGIVHAHILREVLDSVQNPLARAAKFEIDTRKALRPFYDSMVRQDKQAIRRAANERDPHYKPSFRARAIKSLVEDAIGPATRGDIGTLRAFSRAFHMIDDPNEWWKKPGTVARLLGFWATPERIKRERGFYPPKFGPERAEMLERLQLRSSR
ncbi:MAG: FAD-dependent oxidoreductase [Alphaproteobacteria bacterium]|nr:FAD-dependent oxidoreductase [Alphaproteobacteria bacterium]